HLQPELIEVAERRQIRASEGSVRHVEVFQLGGVRTPIIGRPRPLPRQRRADHLYTLNCEEPNRQQPRRAEYTVRWIACEKVRTRWREVQTWRQANPGD